MGSITANVSWLGAVAEELTQKSQININIKLKTDA